MMSRASETYEKPPDCPKCAELIQDLRRIAGELREKSNALQAIVNSLRIKKPPVEGGIWD